MKLFVIVPAHMSDSPASDCQTRIQIPACDDTEEAEVIFSDASIFRLLQTFG